MGLADRDYMRSDSNEGENRINTVLVEKKTNKFIIILIFIIIVFSLMIYYFIHNS
jgi:hypothetical protein